MSKVDLSYVLSVRLFPGVSTEFESPYRTFPFEKMQCFLKNVSDYLGMIRLKLPRQVFLWRIPETLAEIISARDRKV